ncbi:hypothetical protein [uncultured Planococcus sp.]|uniref:hypothetical protein n=1 Tax=Planococcus donghaensis TaxID=414778 RepID=UPI002603D882|nr:hypothetical protein [uncultured Planococcus sp.]
MEALIFGLVIMAISTFFSKGKKGSADDDTPARPVSTPQSTGRDNRSGQRTFKRVEDYAKEIYGELQNQKKQQPERTEQVKRKAEEAVKRTPVREARKEVQRRVTSRNKQSEIQDLISASEARVLQNDSAAPRAEKSNDELLPLSGEDVRRGIIMAEILMPPKSKR